MDTLRSNTYCGCENRALKSLLDVFGSTLSLEDIASAFYKAGRDADMACEFLSAMQAIPSVDTVHVCSGWVKSETSSKSSDDNGFSKSSYANENCDEKASKLERSNISGGYAGKGYVWRAKTKSDANLAGMVTSGTLESLSADTVYFSNDCIKNEISSGKSSANNSYNNKSSCANGNDDSKASGLEKTPSYMAVGLCIHGKDYVWRVRAGQDANPEGEIMRGITTNPSANTALVYNAGLKDETNSGKCCDDNGIKDESTCGKSSDDNAFSNSCLANGNDDSKASRLKKSYSYRVVGSSAHGKVWRVRGAQVANPKGDVLRGMQMSPSLDLANGSNSRIKSETSSRSSDDNGFNKSCNTYSNSDYTQSRLKMSPPAGTLSTTPGKDYVWRPLKGQDVNLTRKLLGGVQTSPSADVAYVSNGGLKSETTSKSSDNNGFSKSYFGNGTDDSEVSRLKRNPVSTGTSMGVVGKDYVWRVRTKRTPSETKPSTEEANKNLGSAYCSEAPLAGRDANSSLNKDFEDFLLDALGKGFQLERSAIQEVLGDCGYDMKKSLDTVLDFAAANLDRRNGPHKGRNLNSDSETFSSQNQGQKQKLSESARRTLRSDGVLSRQPNERESTRRSEVAETDVTGYPEDIAEEHSAKAESCVLVDARDEAEEDDYQILRRTVKEYRDTSKEYYKAAAETFVSGDCAQASILLEKGQFFYNKAREADEESAAKIFEIRDGQIQDMCLDLQHHNAKEALRVLKCHLCSLSGILSIKNLKIILGTGEQNVGKCKRAVIKLLEREAIEWIEDADRGILTIRLDQINPKCLSFTKTSKAI